MDIEIEQKDNKVELLESKLGLADAKVVEEMSELGLKKISSERKGDRIMDTRKNSLINLNYI